MAKPRRPTTPRAELPEKRWQRVLTDGLQEAGWTQMHVRRARVPTSRGVRWLTPTSQPGWPDLVAIRAGWFLAVEVKGPTTPVDAEQVAWLALFAEMPQARAWILRPRDDWTTIGQWIAAPGLAPTTFGFDPTRLPCPPAEYLRRMEAARRQSRKPAPLPPDDGPTQQTMI